MNAAEGVHSSLDALIDKYKTNDYVFKRLINYIEHLLPVALENDAETHKQREERRNQLSANRDEFTARFLQKNNYFYSAQTELFLHYDGLHFVILNEDDIHHQILTTISSEMCLREWKHKVNKNIIKRIKERSPLKAIPESSTIQYVINALCPSIFPTRNHVKYFLTIIGESLTNTNSNSSLIYLFPPALKDIIREIGNQCYTYFGLPNVFSKIKFKYYEHNYKECRLLSLERNYGREKIAIPTLLEKHMLDFLCVAAHYASRYDLADNFLKHCSETRLVEHSLFLAKNTTDTIVAAFIEKTLTPSASARIDLKNIIFLWKKFLNEQSIPNIIFYEALKTNLKNQIKYDDATDSFLGVTSIHLPIVSQFIKFWEETMTDADDGELEVDEICVVFKNWTTNGKIINEVFILDLIQHFYPDVAIQNNKYILNVKCKIWDKHTEVENALKLFKLEDSNVLYDAYHFYSQQSKNKYNLLVSKQYFEKVAKEMVSKEMG
jgi:hypothetical protein